MDNYWIVVQKKSFTRWVNEILKKRNLEIKELSTDFTDGVLLVQLLEILTSKSLKHCRTPRLDVQKLENLTVAFQCMQGDCSIHLINLGPRDIFEGNQKLILALIWSLILHFKIKMGGSDNDANDELIRWINSVIPSYQIKNFTSDWQNGKAICALAEALKPHQMKLPNDFTNDPVKDATLGINCANKNMKIPVIIDPEDMVNHPDKQAMMTYLSYFREYALNQSNLDKDRELEIIPDISKCIVYGPGLEPGNEAEKPTYFTIEIRNAANRKVPQGGHKIFVRITGPHEQQSFQATDHLDGTYYVTYVPNEGGNYVVEVRLENTPIQSSPFHVKIQDVPEVTYSEPVACWFVLKEIVNKQEKWHSYDAATNDLLEKQFQNFGGGTVTILSNSYKVDLTNKEEINLQKKSLMGPEKRQIRRGTWFWVDDDNNQVPYAEEFAILLEKGYKEGKFANDGKVDISDKGKIRYVKETSPGVFNQYRSSSKAKAEGRPVVRGFKGQLLQKTASKKK